MFTPHSSYSQCKDYFIHALPSWKRKPKSIETIRNKPDVQTWLDMDLKFNITQEPFKIRKKRGWPLNNLRCYRSLPFFCKAIRLLSFCILYIQCNASFGCKQNQTAITTSGKLPPNIQRERDFHWLFKKNFCQFNF